MTVKNMAWYEANNDFEGAFERWQTTSFTWKGRWFETCSKIFQSTKEWVNKYIIDPVNKTIHKIEPIKIRFAPRVRDEAISIPGDCPEFDNSHGLEKCYLIEFYNELGELICSKVGTTVRTIQERIREELKSKTYSGMGAKTCVIRRVYNCGEVPAEGAESRFRSEYIKKYPKSFKKNDRFINIQFNYSEADKIFADYIGEKAVA